MSQASRPQQAAQEKSLKTAGIGVPLLMQLLTRMHALCCQLRRWRKTPDGPCISHLHVRGTERHEGPTPSVCSQHARRLLPGSRCEGMSPAARLGCSHAQSRALYCVCILWHDLGRCQNSQRHQSHILRVHRSTILSPRCACLTFLTSAAMAEKSLGVDMLASDSFLNGRESVLRLCTHCRDQYGS